MPRPAPRVLQRKALGSVPGVIYPQELFWLDGRTSSEDMPIAARKAFRVFSLAYTCMAFRAMKLAEAPVWIAEESDDGEAMLQGEHPLSELLEQPNPDMEMAELLEVVSLYLDTTGACLLVKNRDRLGRTGSMYPYARDEFSVEPAEGRLYGRFRVQTLDGYRTIGPEDVIYLHRPSTDGLLGSMAPMDAALAKVNIGYNMEVAIRAAMRNSVKPGAIARTEKSMDESTFERLRAEIAANWAGMHNMGKSMLLEGIDEWLPQVADLKNLELGPINADVEAAVCQCFAIHPILVGSKFGLEASSGFADSLGPALDLFYDLAGFPAWHRIERAFTKGLLREVDDNPRRFIRFDTSKVRALQEDMGKKVTQAKTAETFWTEAEQRAWTGKEGGDTLLPSEKAERAAADALALAQAQPDPSERTVKEALVLLNQQVAQLATDMKLAQMATSFERNGNGAHADR